MLDNNENEYQLINRALDALIMKCPHDMKFNCHTLLEQLGTVKGHNLKDKVRSELVDLGYAETYPNTSAIKLTVLGRTVKRLGGHIKYSEFLSAQNAEAKMQKKLEVESLKTSMSLNSWQYRTRWLPHILSIIALIISILALIKSYQSDVVRTTDKEDSHLLRNDVK